ncbi:MAG: hypothetical protein ACI89X_004539, partial [Planctomycetota bacterium]
ADRSIRLEQPAISPSTASKAMRRVTVSKPV